LGGSVLKRLLVAVAFVVTLGTSPVSAQGSIAGNWITEFDTGIRNVNGVEESMGKRQARLVLEVHGDSISGTWQPLADSAGRLGAIVRLHGKFAADKVTLETEPVGRTVRVNDDERQVKIVTAYAFTLRDDALDGTMTNRALDGSFESNPRPFQAKREKM
jgi:hypothetical protein